jgi:hypothetical protein
LKKIAIIAGLSIARYLLARAIGLEVDWADRLEEDLDLQRLLAVPIKSQEERIQQANVLEADTVLIQSLPGMSAPGSFSPPVGRPVSLSAFGQQPVKSWPLFLFDLLARSRATSVPHFNRLAAATTPAREAV